jgi:hypothetical protein
MSVSPPFVTLAQLVVEWAFTAGVIAVLVLNFLTWRGERAVLRNMTEIRRSMKATWGNVLKTMETQSIRIAQLECELQELLRAEAKDVP